MSMKTKGDFGAWAEWQAKPFLLIEPHPITDIKPYDTDAIVLNGLEVFKHGGEHGHIIVAAIVGFAVVPSIGASLCFMLLKKREKEKEKQSHDNGALCRNRASYRQPKNDKSNATIRHIVKGDGFADHVPSTSYRRFRLPEIVVATNNFDDTLLLRVGGFSKVYMGVINNVLNYILQKYDKLVECSGPKSKQGRLSPLREYLTTPKATMKLHRFGGYGFELNLSSKRKSELKPRSFTPMV
ncbi:Receptor-like protein kinase [Nymphaea thermarum]|nr:Receptor-like protein kinase [Nymphaea thermarum]